MSGWGLVLCSSAVCFALKLAGHLVPTRLADRPDVTRVAGLVTVALLTALVVVQTVASSSSPALVLDARLGALAVAAAALALRAPFLLVVVMAAAAAAGLRAAGLP